MAAVGGLSPAAQAIKAAEPTVDNESPWIDKARIAPRLRRIVDLPCWPEAELQLMAGFPPGDVARYIQRDRGEAQWLARVTLENYLEELRNGAPVYMRIAAFGPIHGERLGKRFGARQAMLQALQKQIAEMEVKLDRLWAAEALDGESRTEEQTKMLNTMVKWIGQAHAIQKDLGLIASEMPAGNGLDIEVVQRIRATVGDGAAALIQDPAVQGRLLEIIRRAQQAAGLPGSGLDEATDYQYRDIYGEKEEEDEKEP
jgi:hypothetical protein